jgi:drug/metabolite transporter (DMT)-like permease
VTVKWVVVLLLAFLSNGMCAVTQNIQQIAFDGAYKNEFMVLALVIVEIVFWALVLWKDRPFLKESFQKGLVPAAACGICNGATNLLVMFLLSMMASSILFPAISAGGIIISFVFSVLVYREPFGLRQGIGVTFGIVAMVLLNL